MRDLVVTENITLDGVIDASEGWFAVADDPAADPLDQRLPLIHRGTTRISRRRPGGASPAPSASR